MNVLKAIVLIYGARGLVSASDRLGNEARNHILGFYRTQPKIG